MSATHASAMAHERGIARNRGQFLLQTLQVFFVGLVIGHNAGPGLPAEFLPPRVFCANRRTWGRRPCHRAS